MKRWIIKKGKLKPNYNHCAVVRSEKASQFLWNN